MNIKNIFYLLVVTFIFSSCEDVIDLELEDGRTRLVVDGFLNSDSSVQKIRITTTAPYFSNSATPVENGAAVKVVGPNGIEYNFINDGDGNYHYNPSTLGPLDSIGFDYKLELVYEKYTYIANSILNPVPVIDSMTVAFEEEGFNGEEGYYTQFYSRDFAGRKDYYWIKPFKNGEPVYKNEPAFMILSEDAAFGGDAADGLVFILPLRASITDPKSPFELVDTTLTLNRPLDVSSVELHSINEDGYQFLGQIGGTNGNDGLFAVPPSNIRSNITDASGNEQDEVLGLFSLSGISKSQIIIK